jgi:hypothetical protein
MSPSVFESRPINHCSRAQADDVAEGRRSSKRQGLASLYGSSEIANDFNVKNEVYKQAQDVTAISIRR